MGSPKKGVRDSPKPVQQNPPHTLGLAPLWASLTPAPLSPACVLGHPLPSGGFLLCIWLEKEDLSASPIPLELQAVCKAGAQVLTAPSRGQEQSFAGSYAPHPSPLSLQTQACYVTLHKPHVRVRPCELLET